MQTVGARMPAEFLRVARDPALRRHLRSATDCYFHLGDHAVEVPGGWLVHFLSDSQWVRHWLLFAGAGEQAVVTTSFPAGFYMAVLDRKRDLVRRCLREQSADFQPTPLREPL